MKGPNKVFMMTQAWQHFDHYAKDLCMLKTFLLYIIIITIAAKKLENISVLITKCTIDYIHRELWIRYSINWLPFSVWCLFLFLTPRVIIIWILRYSIHWYHCAWLNPETCMYIACWLKWVHPPVTLGGNHQLTSWITLYSISQRCSSKRYT